MLFSDERVVPVLLLGAIAASWPCAIVSGSIRLHNDSMICVL